LLISAGCTAIWATSEKDDIAGFDQLGNITSLSPSWFVAQVTVEIAIVVTEAIKK